MEMDGNFPMLSFDYCLIAIKNEKMSPIVNCWTADILCLTIWNALNGKLSSQLGALFNTF